MTPNEYLTDFTVKEVVVMLKLYVVLVRSVGVAACILVTKCNEEFNVLPMLPR